MSGAGATKKAGMRKRATGKAGRHAPSAPPASPIHKLRYNNKSTLASTFFSRFQNAMTLLELALLVAVLSFAPWFGGADEPLAASLSPWHIEALALPIGWATRAVYGSAVFFLHFLVLGWPRWQLLPLYGAVLLQALLLLSPARKELAPFISGPVLSWGSLGCALLSIALSVIQPIPVLPRPSGPFSDVVRSTCVLSSGDTDFTLRLYYPGMLDLREAKPASYTLWGFAPMHGLVWRHMGLPWFLLDFVFGTKTAVWSEDYADIDPDARRAAAFVMKEYRDAVAARQIPGRLSQTGPDADAEKFGKLPIIILSHGLAASPDFYTSIIQDFVSQGYMVAAIEHADGSASYARTLVPHNRETKMAPLPPGIKKDDWRAIHDFRNDQLTIRATEVMTVIDFLERCVNRIDEAASKESSLEAKRIRDSLLHEHRKQEAEKAKKAGGALGALSAALGADAKPRRRAKAAEGGSMNQRKQARKKAKDEGKDKGKGKKAVKGGISTMNDVAAAADEDGGTKKVKGGKKSSLPKRRRPKFVQLDGDQQLVCDMVKHSVDLSRVAIVGHSFGAATALFTAALEKTMSAERTKLMQSEVEAAAAIGKKHQAGGKKKGTAAAAAAPLPPVGPTTSSPFVVAKLRCVVALDPWMFPLDHTSIAAGLPDIPVMAQFSPDFARHWNANAARQMLDRQWRRQRLDAGTDEPNGAATTPGNDTAGMNEELRAFLGDRLTLSAVGRRQLEAKGSEDLLDLLRKSNSLPRECQWEPLLLPIGQQGKQRQQRPAVDAGVHPDTVLLEMTDSQHISWSDFPVMMAPAAWLLQLLGCFLSKARREAVASFGRADVTQRHSMDHAIDFVNFHMYRRREPTGSRRFGIKGGRVVSGGFVPRLAVPNSLVFGGGSDVTSLVRQAEQGDLDDNSGGAAIR